MAEIKTLDQLLDALRHGYTVSDGRVILPPQRQAARKEDKAERHFCVSLAGRVVAIDSFYNQVYSLCSDYLCDLPPEIRISITEKDLMYEREESKKSGFFSRNDYLETLAVYRKICEEMLFFNTFLMHGAVVASGNSAYMFTAESGTGKTTHIKKWLNCLENAYVVNGDKPLIRMTETEAVACGTPWCGKEQMGTNTMVPLKAIVIMERGENNEMAKLTYREAFPFILQQTYQPAGTEQKKKTLHLLSQLKGKVHFYRFVFNNMKEDAFDVAYQTLTEGKCETNH